jgi:UDP-glucose 4-epimerase
VLLVQGKKRMKKILITGGAGYIGSNLVDGLLAQGHKVVVIDNLSTGKIENIQHNLKNQQYNFIKGTILNEKLMQQLISKVDLVYHLAAAVGVKNIIDFPLEGLLSNVAGTEIVLKFAYQYKKRILIASTSEIYGKNTNLPFKEDADRILGPTTVFRWSYSTAKALDEHLAFAYAKRGLKVSIVRYFNSYGPRIDEKGYGSVVAQFIRQALRGDPITVHGDGRQTRCFTFITDTLKGTQLAAEKESAVGQVFNIGNNKEIAIFELAELIKKLTSSNSKIVFLPYHKYYGKHFEDTRRRRPSIRKAEHRLHFKPKVNLQAGLQKTIAWCKEHY